MAGGSQLCPYTKALQFHYTTECGFNFKKLNYNDLQAGASTPRPKFPRAKN
jgi:hypothetical protein